MRFSLKDYQEDAVADVLNRLRRARDDWQSSESLGAFSLTATTGSGKTVMAAAVIESLFGGNQDHDFEPVSGAVVLWFTDDPSLNEQTRFRLIEAADRINHSRLVVIENTFNQEKLEPLTVYFLNAQKLGRNSLLVRGSNQGDGEFIQPELPMPDARVFTMWDTLANTISDKSLTLYLILDEAHRGMKSPNQTGDSTERETIVRRLVNGANGAPPIPIVWGISATVERFNVAMAQARNRTNYPSVVVEPALVQESGLLKDDIRLEFPKNVGHIDYVLLARATRKAKQVTDLWSNYTSSEKIETVVPLLIVQVPNTPSDELLSSAIDTIRENWQELERDAMAHVFGDHNPIELAGFHVPHVSPEMVQDRTSVRVLFAKDAISTGWDCPRAEVLISFRPARDETHITQLLGRVMRTPLARRVQGNDLLNSVTCVLPRFDRRTATQVAHKLTGDRELDSDGTGGGRGRRVLFAGVDMKPNSAIPEAVWEVFDELPTQTLPRKAARPIRRLSALAQALSRDGLKQNARKTAYQRLFDRLDGLMVQHQQLVAAFSNGILQVEGAALIVRVIDGEVREQDNFFEAADEQFVDANFRAGARILTGDIARMYTDYLTERYEENLFDARVKVAALAQVETVPSELDREADCISSEWFAEHRVAIMALRDERQAIYDDIKGMSSDPQVVQIRRPRVRTEETENREGEKLETRSGHLMSDADGKFPIVLLNQWEINVVDQEMNRDGFIAWYRNPARPSTDALSIAYRNTLGDWRRMCPDFIFFHQVGQEIRASIVDPHGHHLADALAKLRGLAEFTEMCGESFHRIESVARMSSGVLRVLDITRPDVRSTIMNSQDVEAIYLSPIAVDY